MQGVAGRDGSDPGSEVEIEITVEGTPNPNAAKFVLGGVTIGETSRSYFDPNDAADDPLAERLFAIDGVRAVFMVDDFITVTKTDEADWTELVDRVESAIRSGLSEG